MVEEVFKSENFQVCLCESTEMFQLKIFNETLHCTYHELKSIKKQIFDIDMADLLHSDTPDIEPLFIAHCQRYFLLNFHHIIELKNLLKGTFINLAVNSIIQKTKNVIC